MISKNLVLLLLGALIFLAQCSSDSEKESVSKEEIIQTESKKKADSLQSEESKKESEDKRVPGAGEDSDNLTKILDKIEGLEKKIEDLDSNISKLTQRFEDTKTENASKPVVRKKSKSKSRVKLRKAKRLNREIAVLKRKLQKKIVQSQRLIKSLSHKNTGRFYSSKYGRYRIYLGTFRYYNNAVKRRKYVSRLGIATSIRKKKWSTARYTLDERDPYKLREVDGDIYVQEQSRSYYKNRYQRDYYYGYNLYQVVSAQHYDFNKAVQLTNFLLSRGYEAFIRKTR